MTPTELRKAMQVIDKLGEHIVDLQKQDVLVALSDADVKNPAEAIQELEDAGLIQVEGTVVRKIAKHMFW